MDSALCEVLAKRAAHHASVRLKATQEPTGTIPGTAARSQGQACHCRQLLAMQARWKFGKGMLQVCARPLRPAVLADVMQLCMQAGWRLSRTGGRESSRMDLLTNRRRAGSAMLATRKVRGRCGGCRGARAYATSSLAQQGRMDIVAKCEG